MDEDQPNKRRLSPWLKNTLQVLGFFVLVVAVQWWAQRDSLKGEAPTFSATTLEGKAFSLEQLKGSGTIVHFWARWCPICRAEEGMIDSLAQEVDIITIALQSGDTAAVRKYMDDNQLSFPVINDPDGELASRYGIRGVPTSFILDEKSNIRFVETGFSSKWGLQVRLWLADLLPANAGT